MNFNSILEELDKLYEEKVVSKETDKLCSVVFDGEQQMFTGTKDECEKWIKAKKGPNASRFSIKDSAAVNVVEEGCAKEALKEAAEEEAEIVDDEAVEESEEEIPEETIDTVEDFVKNFDEYDGKLKLEFKPIVIDGKEYPIKQLLWDDTLEEGKLVAEVIFDMPEEEEEPAEEEIPEEVIDEEPVEENLNTEKLPEEDEDLDEFLNANIKVDARGFGGSGNAVDII